MNGLLVVLSLVVIGCWLGRCWESWRVDRKADALARQETLRKRED